MGLQKFIRTKILEPIFGVSKGDAVADFVVSEVQKAVAVLKTTDLGGAIAKIVTDVTTKTNPDGSVMTGSEKFASVLADSIPLVEQFLTNKGAVGVAVTAVEDVARELVQSIFNDTKSTTAGSLATQVLALFGVKI